MVCKASIESGQREEDSPQDWAHVVFGHGFDLCTPWKSWVYNNFSCVVLDVAQDGELWSGHVRGCALNGVELVCDGAGRAAVAVGMDARGMTLFPGAGTLCTRI